MPGDGFTLRGRIRNLLRSPAEGKQRGSRKESLCSQVTLEKVLGVTATGNSGLASDPCSGVVAYPAGCVVVLLNPKTDRQQHIINTSRKTITALSFSPDGKLLVTGESGHLPAVRLWDVAGQRQVAELQRHKYGVSCVAFSPNGKYIVSVGNQHDQQVNVWAWKKDVVVAANKVSSKVTGVSFAEDTSYFVTVGNRHVKFWYLDHCKNNKSGAPVPLLGRSGLLGELRNNFFCAVACGRGSKSDSAFCVTSSGLLCEIDHRRMLDKWVDVRTGAAQSLCVSGDLVFCGCSDGTVRVFGASDLSFVCTLPRPHPLGSDSAPTHSSQVSHSKTDARYPDAIAVAFDPVSRWVACVYSDHSLYVWDVRDPNRAGKVHSALYHGACVWDLEMFPDVPGHSGLSSGSFLTCSADNTIRMWHLDNSPPTPLQPKNPLSTDLVSVLHVDGNSAALVDSESSTNVGAEKNGEGHTAETRAGIRTICVSPDGKHLASGDRTGILRVHDLSNMEEVLKVEAHDTEILCLEYSKPDTGLRFLATASRDRLIHVLDADRDYGLVQTLDEHSSSITAVRFTVNDDKVRMISCGADKSIYFRTAHTTDRGTEFRRSHHSVRRSTLYDMSVDPTSRFAAVGCQDRCIRLFNISSGKQKKLYKGSLSEDGSLLKVQIDPSGRYVATSCSDKNMSLVDFSTGECVATMFGHSEIITGIKFTNDCRRLISVSGDSCIFVWRLGPELTLNMRERLRRLREEPLHPDNAVRRESYSALPLGGLSSESDHEHEGNVTEEDHTLTSTDSSHEEEEEEEEEEEGTGGSDEGQEWEKAKPESVGPVSPEQRKRPRRRWSHRMVSLELMVKSMLDLRQLETLGQKNGNNTSPVQSRDRRSMSNLHDPQVDDRARRRRAWPRSDWSSQSRSVPGAEEVPPFPEERRDSDYTVRESSSRGRWRGGGSQDSRSPDSACSLGYDSRESSPNCLLDDVDSLKADSSEEEGCGEERDRAVTVSSVEEALRAVTEDHGPADLHKNKTLAQTNSSSSSTAEQSPVPRHSMSSHFLNQGHNRRSAPVFGSAHGREQDGPQPPVSKVRPLMEDGQDRSSQDDASTSAKSLRSDSVVIPRAQKTTSRHFWRLSVPSAKATSLLETTTGLHKAHSVQNLTSESPVSPMFSSDRRQPLKRPQQLFLNQTKPCPLPRSSSTSPLCPHSPLPPWDAAPSPRTPHSYMNPTASSKAKISRSSSVGEGLQVGTPPRSPSLPRQNRDLAAASLLSSSVPLSVAKGLSSGPPLRATVAPSIVAPSRIPLPKQPLSPRRSLGLECCQSRPSTPTCTDPASDAGLAANKQAPSRHPSPEKQGAQSLLPVKQRRTPASESAEEAERAAVGKERPLVDEECGSSSGGLCRDESITVETCRQVATELQDCLRRTIHFYSAVVDSGPDLTEEQQRMKSVLSSALLSVKTELHSLPPHGPQRDVPQRDQQGGRGEGDSASALLEQYAQLLLQSVEKKLDNKA